MREWRIFGVVCAASALAACAAGPDYEPASASSLGVPAAYSSADSASPVSEAELAAWWTRFNDPALDGVVERAIARGELQPDADAYRLIETLVARSSLIVALYWRRRDTLCESHAHHALVDAIAARDGPLAEELMHGHLVDLLSGLDLRERATTPRRLREMLAP